MRALQEGDGRWECMARCLSLSATGTERMRQRVGRRPASEPTIASNGSTGSSGARSCIFASVQLVEIAAAMEESQHSYIWEVGNSDICGESKNEGKGGPDRGICSSLRWNSTLEALSTGVPMAAWPIFAEQFYNEKLITQVLKIGVAAGSTWWVMCEDEKRPVIGRKEIQRWWMR